MSVNQCEDFIVNDQKRGAHFPMFRSSNTPILATSAMTPTTAMLLAMDAIWRILQHPSPLNPNLATSASIVSSPSMEIMHQLQQSLIVPGQHPCQLQFTCASTSLLTLNYITPLPLLESTQRD
jgi:hypothetical protein